MKTRVPDIVGLKEIAHRLDVQPQTAAAWKYRGLLPEPDGNLGATPWWRWKVIKRWAQNTGRLYDDRRTPF